MGRAETFGNEVKWHFLTDSLNVGMTAMLCWLVVWCVITPVISRAFPAVAQTSRSRRSCAEEEEEEEEVSGRQRRERRGRAGGTPGSGAGPKHQPSSMELLLPCQREQRGQGGDLAVTGATLWRF